MQIKMFFKPLKMYILIINAFVTNLLLLRT